jgi:hypothetical protein
MRLAMSALGFLLLMAINSGLGAQVFTAGLVPASLLALALGVGLGFLTIRWNDNWKHASRNLILTALAALVLGSIGLMQSFDFVSDGKIDLAGDMNAISAAGRTLFLVEGLGMFLAYRHWTPRSRLPEP